MPRPAGIINCEATSLVGAFAPIIQITVGRGTRPDLSIA